MSLKNINYIITNSTPTGDYTPLYYGNIRRSEGMAFRMHH